MHDICYKYIKNKNDDKAELLFDDTDSLIYEIETETVYEDLNKDKKLLTSSIIQKNQIIMIRRIT